MHDVEVERKDIRDIYELSMDRKCGQSVTTDDRRTFTDVLGADKDKVPRDQTLGKVVVAVVGWMFCLAVSNWGIMLSHILIGFSKSY